VLNAFPADGSLPGLPELSRRPATAADAGWIAELRAEVLRESLERLGRYDPQRVRARFLKGFRADDTSVLRFGRQPVGSLALRGEAGDIWVEHFYLASAVQGRGFGAGLLTLLTAQADALGVVLRLNVLRMSAAQRLYARHGFVVDSADEVDVFMIRRARSIA
jgi:GNAT superfamily N-acetyltransferase